MARYENLKDYFQKVHLELIRNTISNFLISELHDDRQIRNAIVRSLECTNDDAYYNVEIELGVSVELTEKSFEDASDTLFFILTITGNLELKFEDIRVTEIRQVNEFPEDNILSQFILPDLPINQLERIGSYLYNTYKKLAGFNGIRLSLEHIINILPIYFAVLDDKYLGRINMLESDVEIFHYDIKEERLKEEGHCARPGTILLNKKRYFDERDGELLITVAHELVHWMYHRRFFMILVLLGVDSDKMNCETQPNVFDDSMTDIEKARCIAEWQADVLAMRLAIPEHTVDEVITEIANDPSTYYENSGDRMQACVIKFAKKYGVSCYAAKKRLRQLGYDFVDGTIIEFDGEKKKPFYFTPSTLKENETFVLDNANYKRLMREDNRFAEMINSGRYIYIGYVVCLLDSKYIDVELNENSVKLVLSDYARGHADECCLKFSTHIIYTDQRYISYGQTHLSKTNKSELKELEAVFTESDKKIIDDFIKENKAIESFNSFGETLSYYMFELNKENPIQVKNENGYFTHEAEEIIKELSFKSDISNTAIKRYLNNKGLPKVKTAMRVCLCLDLNNEESRALLEMAGFHIDTRLAEYRVCKLILGRETVDAFDILDNWDVCVNYFKQQQ